jgi:hypothetical protein
MHGQQNIKFTAVLLFNEKDSRGVYKRVDLLTPR